MKALFLSADLGIPILGRKGAAVHVRAMVRALRQVGNSVVVAAPVLTKSEWETPAELEPPLLHVPPVPDVELTLRAVREFGNALGGDSEALPADLRRVAYNGHLCKELPHRFRQDPPDFVYERASLYGTAGVQIAAAAEVPILIELNAPLTMEQATYRASALTELAREAERWMLNRADAVLVVSRELREYAIALGVEPCRIHVVPNGVDVDLFHPRQAAAELRRCWGLSDGPLLGFVGGLRPWHGVEALPALMAKLCQVHPRAQLVIVGEGPMRRELEHQVRADGLERSILFTGALAQQDVARLVPHFDVALAPYRKLEHSFYFSPLKLFEYMAAGVAVAAPRLGQIAEILRDGETGLLYPDDDSDALARACLRLLDDPELRTRLGTAAAREVRTHYTWTRNAERVTELAGSLREERGICE